MPIRLTLITTAAAALTAWPLATSALAEPDEPSGGGSPPLQVAAPHAADLLVVEVPPLPPPLLDVPPSAAREAPSPTTLVVAPAAEPPAIANSPPVAAASAAEAAAWPLNSGQANRRSAARAAKTQAARPSARPALILLNARESPVVSVTVTAGDTTVRQTRLVGPNARATVPLPTTSGCSVTVGAVFEDDAASEVRSIDACRVKLVRLTD
jgi:Meckel syndrome type 1 protein